MRLSSWLVFRVCLTVRVASALWNLVNDCDETFNYWEPLHRLLHGKLDAFQTWEYSPDNALRSYLYLYLYYPPAKLVYLLGGSRVSEFYAVRIWTGACTAAAETAAFAAVKRRLDAFGDPGSVYSAAFAAVSAASAGAWSAGTAFLPSAFAMQLSHCYLSAWLTGRDFLAVLCVAAMSIVGWPFAAALGLPLAADLALARRRPWKLVASSVLCGALLGAPVAVADCFAYGRLTFSPLNLLRYNVLNSGSQLYGTEPASYYAINYALNFSPLMPALLLTGSLLALYSGLRQRKWPVSRQSANLSMWLSPLLVWNLVFFAQAHKEERFLYPCYPFVCLAAAASLEAVRRRLGNNWIVPCLLAGCAILGASRIAAVTVGYQSHVTVYHRLWLHQPPGRLCLGREWHRFPSHFLVPDNWTVSFIRSEFRGQLPGKFGRTGQGFNLDNKEEIDRYVDPLKGCDYLIDRRSARATQLEPDFSSSPDWRILEDLPFLEPGRSHRLFRAFYAPWLFDRKVNFTSYLLLQRVEK